MTPRTWISSRSNARECLTMFTRITVAVLTLLASFDVAYAARPTPPIGAASDVADWRSAKLGREKLPAELGVGADGLLVITGGAFANSDVAQVAALADAAGFDVVNLAHRDLAGDAAAMTTA